MRDLGLMRPHNGIPYNGQGGDPMADVFISHVEEDASIAAQIGDALEADGYSTWYYERDSIPGPSYLLQTAGAIERSKLVVLIISPHALGSHQVTKEVVRAHESGKPFIPVLHGISHVEFGNRQPEWREAVGSATSVAIPRTGVSSILPRILEGVRSLGIEPSPADETGARPSFRPYVPPSQPVWKRLGRIGFRQKVIVAAVVAAVVAGGTTVLMAGGGGGGKSPTAQRSETVDSPGDSLGEPLAGFDGEPTPSGPEKDARNTPLETSQGQLRVVEARLVTQVCPPAGIPGPCRKTSGSNRYLILKLTGSDGSAPALTQTFNDEAFRSTVSYDGRRYGSSSTYLDEGNARVEVTYGVLPAAAAQGKVLLIWPDNPLLKLTIKT